MWGSCGLCLLWRCMSKCWSLFFNFGILARKFAVISRYFICTAAEFGFLHGKLTNYCLRHRQLAEGEREGAAGKEIGVLSPGAFLYRIYNVSFPWQRGNLHTYILLKSPCIFKVITSVKGLFFKLIICYFLFILCMPRGWVRALQSGSPRLVLIRGWVMEQRVWRGSNWIPWCLDFNVVKNPRPGGVVYCSGLSPCLWSCRKHSMLLLLYT